jgi:hypothetical protein
VSLLLVSFNKGDDDVNGDVTDECCLQFARLGWVIWRTCNSCEIG